MFFNYLKIGLRNIRKQKAYSFINIAGLAVGMTCCILILLYVQDELSYDRYHEKAPNIYRVITKGRLADRDFNIAVSPPPLARALTDEFPEVKQTVRLFKPKGEVFVRYEDKRFNEKRLFYADASIFEVFSFPLIQGDSKTALSRPNSLVLTETTAKKYFGDRNPVGQTLSVDESADFQVTGVVEDVPLNSHFHFDFLASLVTLDLSRSPSWINSSFHTYLVLQKEYPSALLEAKFPVFIREHVGPQIKAGMGISIDDFFALGNSFGFFLQPLRDIHLHSNLDFELEANSDVKYVYIFSAIALFILLIACINFMNLSTARSASRANEVGVRKMLGSNRSQLISQFLAESVFFSSLALLLAVAFVELLLPLFKNLSGKKLEMSFGNWLVLPSVIGIALLVGILAGSYPAFFLSSFKPVIVLKGGLKTGIKSTWLRSGLVVFQFCISIVLLVGTFVIYGQLEFIRNRKLGYESEHVVIIPRATAVEHQREVFKRELMQHSGIISASVSDYLPGRGFDITGFRPEGVSEEEFQAINFWRSDHDFARTLKLEMTSGRFFSKDYSTDSFSIVINERAAEILGLENPVGKHLMTTVKGSVENLEIIGVVKDFHFESMHQKIRPMAIRLLPEGKGNYLSVRISSDNVAKTLAFLNSMWERFAPDQPFEYFFMSEDFDDLYKSEKRTGQLFTIFSTLSIFIACLGLFGLTSFTAERRTKEIGIRKVLGATVSSIVILLSKEFTRWVVVANIIAWPIAYYVMNRWLQNFAYHTGIRIWVFVVSALSVIVIAWVTMSFQAVKAALSNPAKALRYE